MPTPKTPRTLLAAWFCLFLLAVPALSQDDAPPTIESVQLALDALEASEAEGEEALVEAYAGALEALRAAAEAAVRAQQNELEAIEAPLLLKTIREELAGPAGEVALGPVDGLTLSELESRLQQADAELVTRRAKIDEFEQLGQERTRRATEIPVELAAAQQALSVAEEDLSTTPGGPESDARRALYQARIEEQRARVAALEAERDNHEARRELLPLRRERALRRLALAEKMASAWKQLVDTRRTADGEAAALLAKQRLAEITESFPALRKLAQRNQELAALRSGDEGLPKRISAEELLLEKTRVLLEETERRSTAARRRIAAAGLSEAMALTLRSDFEWLPRAAELRAASVAREKRHSLAQLELIEIEEERAGEAGSMATQQRLLAEIGADASDEQLAEAAAELLAERREVQAAALSDLARLTKLHFDHEQLSKQLLVSAAGYRAFIQKRILWVPSAANNPLVGVAAVPAHLVELAEGLAQASLLSTLLDRVRAELPFSLAVALLLLALAAGRARMQRRRVELASELRSYVTDRYGHTLHALALTLLLAAFLPLFFWALGWLLSSSADGLARSIGVGLLESSKVWLVLRFLRGLLVEKGVGQAHFKWPGNSLKAVRGELTWFEPVAVVLGFVFHTLDVHDASSWSESIGRIAFVLAMAALAVFLHRLMRAESDLWSSSMKSGKGLLGKTHRLWSLIATGLPIALGLLALGGYYYTALQFEFRLLQSLGLAVVLVLIDALLLRWLFIARRRLAVAQALEARAKRAEDQEVSGGAEAGNTSFEDEKVDIPAIDAQTRQLFKSSISLAAVVGLFLIWASVLPALRGLDRVQLLPTPAIVSAESDLGQIAAPRTETPKDTATQASQPTPGMLTPAMSGALGSSSQAADGEQALPSVLTLADLLLALVFLLLTTVAARNLPALLELSVLPRLPLDSGSRYAVVTIVRYLILLVGVSAISGALGIGWQKVQWLAAALTFGLAFGLQEIFANFVSGLIILIERPIRVGDVVTVGGIEGRVTQLRMRATTIQDWDRKELLIPNKEFITGSVINWTLTDPVTRYVIPVGIAYGSDVELARKLLLEVAARSPLILADPAPQAIFRAFGESSLDFELRIFMPNRDHWPVTVDRMHTDIDAAFRAAGIEIAFPQRDIHVRSGLHGESSGATEEPAN